MVMDGRSRKPLQRSSMAAAGVNRVYINELCYIRDDDPDTNYGYPDTAQFYIENGVGHRQAFPVFKFASPLPTLPSGLFNLLFIGESRKGFEWDHASAGTGSGNMWLFAIKEDFDASTITWNSYAALSKQTASSHLNEVSVTTDTYGHGIGEGAVVRATRRGLITTASGSSWSSALSGAYGFLFFFAWSGPGSGSWVRYEFQRRLIRTDIYAGWLEWF